MTAEARPAARRALADRLRSDDAGALVTAVPIIALMFLLLAGLVIDSSRQLTARARAVSYAEEAARAGAAAIDPVSDPLKINPNLASQQVKDYCLAASQREPQLDCHSTHVDEDRVEVAATISLPSGLLGLVGIETLHAHGEGEARPLIGVTGRDAR